MALILNNQSVQLIEIQSIQLDCSNIDVHEILMLSDDIEENGLQSPVTLDKEGSQYRILNGRKRVAAFCLLNNGITTSVSDQWSFIPAIVIEPN